MEKKNYTLLDQFVDSKCEISFHSLLDNSLSATYVYNSFSYQLDNEHICFQDQTEDDCVLTSIELSKINSISNLTNDTFTDAVTFSTNKYIVNVCTLERKFIYPRCCKCSKEILTPEETIWRIRSESVNYGSHFDDYESLMILSNLDFCDSCIQNFVGDLVDEICELQSPFI